MYIIIRTLNYSSHTQVRTYLASISPETYSTSRRDALPFDSAVEAHTVKKNLAAYGKFDISEK